MDSGELKEESGLDPGPKADPVADAMGRASWAAMRGDFKSAREIISRTRERVRPGDRTRLDALDRSFRVDRAALVAIGLTAAILLTIGLVTLFH